MYSQANVRAGKVLRSFIRALPSVIVDTEKVLREADGPVEMSALTLPPGGKVFAPGCASKAGRGEEPEEHKGFVKWAMKRCSKYAKQFQKCNVPNVFSIGIKE